MNELKQDDLTIRVVWTSGCYCSTTDISPTFYDMGKGDSGVFNKLCVDGKVTLVETMYAATIEFPIVYSTKPHTCTVVDQSDQSESKESIIRNAVNSKYLVGFGDVGGLQILIIASDTEELYRTATVFIRTELWRNYIDINLKLLPELIIYGYWRLYDGSNATLTKGNHPCMRLQDIRSYILNIRPIWTSVMALAFNLMENIKNGTLGEILNELLTYHDGIVCYDKNDTIRRLTDMDEILVQLIATSAEMYICCIVGNPDRAVFTMSCSLELAITIGQLVLRDPAAIVVGYWKEGE